jgi:putative membrane protein
MTSPILLSARSVAVSNFKKMSPMLAGIGVYCLVVSGVDHYTGGAIHLTAGFHTLIGLMLGLLLVFRTNTAYDRWWEGRKLWGQLVNDCRNFAVKIAACVRAEQRDKIEIADRLSAFAFALKDHLRGGVKLQSLETFEHDEEQPEHVPSYIVARIYDRLERWRLSDQLGGFELLFLDRHAAALLDICGGCERILKTPISRGYRRFILQSIWVYIVTLPWGIVDDIGWWTAPVTIVVAYLLVGIEVLAEQAEDPFGTDIDDLPLDDICATIDRNLQEIVER